MDFDDNQALCLARYQRAARFPAMPTETILLSYEPEIQTFLNGLHSKVEHLKPAIRQLIKAAIGHMMTLPASSSHHHRTSGGLFFHSFEVALLAWQYGSEQATVRAAIAAFIGGLLHDLGKTLSLFEVTKLAPFDPYLIQIERSRPEGPKWNPAESTLSAWCKAENVEYLALQFRYRPQIGHVTLGAQLWRDLVPDELLTYIGTDQTLLDDLVAYLDGDRKQSFIRSMVGSADRESVNRDLNPGLRTSPKRTEMHMARRFIEFQFYSPWNTVGAPFVHAELYLGDEQSALGQTYAFFVATPENIKKYVAYVGAEDMYGHVAPHNQASHLLYTLESLGGPVTV